MRPYADIQTDRLKAALDERKKAGCGCCAAGKPCAKVAEAAVANDQRRAYIDRVVARLVKPSET